MGTSNIEALVFDVFGTVVDWRSSIASEAQKVLTKHGADLDWNAFADNWRKGYAPAMDRVRTGEIPWHNLDDLHRMLLDDLLEDYGVTGIRESDIYRLNQSWHRLTPWPDSVEGLQILKSHFVISTLSNGNFSMLTNMAKFSGLPWDCIISAELAGHYKPDQITYQTACSLLSLPPDKVMMVAAHTGDLEAAKQVGMKTAYVHRPLEFGPNRKIPMPDPSQFDVTAQNFLGLATSLQC